MYNPLHMVANPFLWFKWSR